ncbi:hypothetical protein CNMCM5793_006577 [Aspergillus hiratsukae]|uniref:Uncharacterized protein n=1 Tax=Aspergillus hiratsukae TaxID=1194566 RepID=A0A8H6V094_9EURO|nr:hypothetical protein CNMCM5793_006577 [Aspergillus hiratsukae]KAF7173292.1 hypothetical protein CNMCM6106_007407 [Aspergillus hiratsukae]
MAENIKHTGLSLHFAEAVPCRLDRIKTEWSKCIENHRPDTVLQLAVLLSKVEQVLGIEYPSDIPSPTVEKPTCVVCRRSYTRCQTEYNTHKQLVYHEKSIHKAAYRSRVEFGWPGFIQFDSKEAQKSFLKNLGGDEESKVYTFVEEVADQSPPCLETLHSILGTQIDGQYSANDQTDLQYDDSGFYLDIPSLLSLEPPTFVESSLRFSSDNPV